MPLWFVARHGLSVSQRSAVELSCDRHRVITGPPGSGKTLVLLHRARHLLDRWHIPAERLRILCYTNALKAFLQSACDVLRLPSETVETFHAWCRRQYEEAYHGAPLPGAFAGKPMFGTMVDQVLAATRNGFDPESLDVALVDEGQDLSADAFDLLRRAARHVTVAFDYKQRIFEDGASAAAILQALRVPARDVALLEAFRSSPPLVALASRFVDDAVERSRFLAQNQTGPRGGETPLLYIAANAEDEMAHLAEVLSARLALGEHVAVLLPTRGLVEGAASFLRSAGIAVEVPPPRGGGRPGPHPVHDFTNTAPKVMAYPSVKGLTFDSVLLPHLCAGAFPWQSAERLRKILFVALSRARRWAYLGTIAGREPAVLEDAELLHGQDLVAMKEHSSAQLRLFDSRVRHVARETCDVRRSDSIDDLLC